MRVPQQVTLVDVRTADGLRLDGAFRPGQKYPRASGFDAVLLMHGVASSFYAMLSPTIAEALTGAGYPVLVANNRGHDVISRGTIAQPYLGAAFERIEDATLDWTAWLDWLAARGYEHILVAGHSLGGVKTAHVFAHGGHATVRGCALLSPPRFSYASWLASARADEFREHLARAQAAVDAGRPDDLLRVTMPVPFIIGAAAYLAKYGAAARFDVFENLVRIAHPVVAFTGERELDGVDFRDHPVEYERASAAKPDLTHHLIPGADHFYAGCEEVVVRHLLRWMVATAPVRS